MYDGLETDTLPRGPSYALRRRESGGQESGKPHHLCAQASGLAGSWPAEGRRGSQHTLHPRRSPLLLRRSGLHPPRGSRWSAGGAESNPRGREERTLALLRRVNVPLPHVVLHHDARPVMRRHGNVDVRDPLGPPLHELGLVLCATVLRVRPDNLDGAVLDDHGEGRRVDLLLCLAGRERLGREGPEGEDVVEGLVEFVDEDDVVGLGEAEPVVRGG